MHNCIRWFTSSDSSLMQVPVLETPEGSDFESNAIACYGKRRNIFWFNCFFSLGFCAYFAILYAKVARGSSLFGSSAIEYVSSLFGSFQLKENNDRYN